MSYVTDHHCPTTLLLIHLRNARDLARAANPTGERTLLDELPLGASRLVASEIAKAIKALEKAIEVTQGHRGKSPTPVARK
jgi:hypothetical protein